MTESQENGSTRYLVRTLRPILLATLVIAMFPLTGISAQGVRAGHTAAHRSAAASAGIAPRVLSRSARAATSLRSARVGRRALLAVASCIGPQLLQNGGFESGDLSGWTVDGTAPPPAVTTSTVHSGGYAAVLGSSNPPEPLGDSSFFQVITVPVVGAQLSYWYNPATTDSISFDWQDAYVTNASGTTVLATIMHVDTNTQTWTPIVYDLTRFAGQTVGIKFLVHQDGFGDPTSMVLDDVQVTACMPPPTLTSLTPMTGTAAGGTTVTLTGTNFFSPVTVTFGTLTTTATVVSETQLTAVTPPTSTGGTVPVTVSTEAGSSDPLTYTYVATPTITGLNPTTGPLAGGTTVVVTGTDFDPTGVETVTFGGLPAPITGYSGTTLITVTSPATSTAGTVDVRVTTLGGTSPITPADQFTYAAPPSPTPSNTPLPTSTNTPPPTVTPTPTQTNLPPPPATATGTSTPPATATATSVPSATASATAVPTSTSTPVPPTAVPTATSVLLVAPVQPTTIYFAEGYTGRSATTHRADFDEFLSVFNPDNVAKPVTITYQIQGQNGPSVKTIVVAPNSDVLENVNGDVGNDRLVSAIVSSPGRIAAERVINRTTSSGRLDSDSSLGTTTPGTTWAFAEGYAGATFQEYLTLQNPGASTAAVTVTFLPQDAPAATAPLPLTFTVPAQGRATENIRRAYLPYPHKSIGLLVTSDHPIVAERVLYFGDGIGSAKYGATSKAGLTAPARQFFFAYGSTTGPSPAALGPAQQANDQGFVTLINPASPVGSSAAAVTVRFFGVTGTLLGTKAVSLPAGARETLAESDVISPTAGPYYTVVTADQPIFAEKAQYIGGSPNIGQHPGLALAGAPAGLTATLFPNVNTASATGAPISETVFLLNPGTAAVTVNGTYYTPSGQTVSMAYTLAGRELRVINVNADAGNLPAGPLGAQYTTNNGAFVAARIANTPDQRAYIGNQGSAIP